MSLSEETLNSLQNLIAQDKQLLAQIRIAKNATQVATIIAQAAAKGGVSVCESEVLTHLEDALNASTDQALTDGQLDAVAGGRTPTPVGDLEWLVAISITVKCANPPAIARPRDLI